MAQVPGFEPGTTVPKTVVISVSPHLHQRRPKLHAIYSVVKEHAVSAARHTRALSGHNPWYLSLNAAWMGGVEPAAVGFGDRCKRHRLIHLVRSDLLVPCYRELVVLSAGALMAETEISEILGLQHLHAL
jgi:hypothetical protein